MANLKLKENLDIKSTGISTSGQNALPKTGDIIPFAGIVAPSGWAICDGTNGTPDLRGMYVVGATSSANIGSTLGNSTHTHTYSTNSFSTGDAVNSHDGVDTGVSAGGNQATHAHSITGVTYNSDANQSNLLANSTTAGGPIQFNPRPHSHTGGGNVNFDNGTVGTHGHNGFGLLSSNRTDSHSTGHSITTVPSGNAPAASSLVPFIIMNYIMKV
jgi:microcystin-dependent protein